MSERPSAMSKDESRAVLEHLTPWRKPTVAQIRNCVLTEAFIIPQDPDSANNKLLTDMPGAFGIAVKGGRLFDMGHLPNRMIQSESGRATELFLAGHIGHPFSEPYCFFHTWDSDTVGDEEDTALARELGVGMSGSLYVVDPLDWHHYSKGAHPPGTFMVCEAQAVRVFRNETLLVGDIVFGAPGRGDDGRFGYQATVVRGVLNEGSPERGSASNLLDPVMSCLLLLATDGIDVRTVAAPEKLNKHRVKAGKPAIPGHYAVQTEGYVTALSNRYVRRRGPGDGHHASPVPHLRRGHVRHLHEMHGGGTVFVRDAVINLKDPDAPLARSFYQRQQEAS